MNDLSDPKSATPVTWIEEPEPKASPIVKRLPYVEMQLSYPDLDATHHNGVFFPCGVPYQFDGERRVFYWTNTVFSSLLSPRQWGGICATTWDATPIVSGTATRPRLWTEHDSRYEVVSDGDITATARTAMIRDASPPVVYLVPFHGEPHCIVTRSGSESVKVPRGDTHKQDLPPHQLILDGGSSEEVTATPQLTVRYLGIRTIYHPTLESDTVLFPSFGIDLEEIPNPVMVQTDGETVNEQVLADELGVALDERPYAERVLWQVFTYTAFGPHRSNPPQLTQTDSDLLILKNPIQSGSPNSDSGCDNRS